MPKTAKPDWEQDLDAEAVDRSAQYEIRPRIELPGVGEVIRVTFLDEPRLVENPNLPQGKAWFVTVDEGDGVAKDLVLPKTIRFELAKLRRQGKIGDSLKGVTVYIGGRALRDYTTRDGEHVKEGKTYWVQVAEQVEKKGGELRL